MKRLFVLLLISSGCSSAPEPVTTPSVERLHIALDTAGTGHNAVGEPGPDEQPVDAGSPAPEPPAGDQGDAAKKTTGGSLPRAVIKHTVMQHLDQVKYCYEKGLARDKTLTGKVTIKFLIEATGAVKMAAVASSTLGDEEVENCIALAVRKWTFPSPDGDGIVIVTYPFVLVPEDK